MNKLAKILVLLSAVVLMATGCKKLPEFTDGKTTTVSPTVAINVYTQRVTGIGDTKAYFEGFIDNTEISGLTVTVGFCWNTTGNPTLNDNNITAELYENFHFNCTAYGLVPNTTYYLKAWAIIGTENPDSAIYGNEESFTTTATNIIGSGTVDDPYNVESGINLQGQNVIGWVQGYIVGAVKSGITTVTNNDDIVWEPPFDARVNVVIADDITCHEIANCIIVSLPNNTPLRTQVNLYDHPDNFDKQLAVSGTLRTYYGQAGLRDSGGTESDFVLEGGVTPPSIIEIFSETFETGQGDFQIVDVISNSSLPYVWSYASIYQCMTASAFQNGQSYQTESWLVSPNINIQSANNATLQFDQAVNYASPEGFLSVMISTNYTGDVTSTSWTVLDLDQWPSGTNWTFVRSSADLTQFIGQNITIAFKYTSSDGFAPTWEVKNVVVSGS